MRVSLDRPSPHVHCAGGAEKGGAQVRAGAVPRGRPGRPAARGLAAGGRPAPAGRAPVRARARRLCAALRAGARRACGQCPAGPRLQDLSTAVCICCCQICLWVLVASALLRDALSHTPSSHGVNDACMHRACGVRALHTSCPQRCEAAQRGSRARGGAGSGGVRPRGPGGCQSLWPGQALCVCAHAAGTSGCCRPSQVRALAWQTPSARVCACRSPCAIDVKCRHARAAERHVCETVPRKLSRGIVSGVAHPCMSRMHAPACRLRMECALCGMPSH